MLLLSLEAYQNFKFSEAFAVLGYYGA